MKKLKKENRKTKWVIKMEIYEEIEKLKEAIAVLSSAVVELRGKTERLNEKIERIEDEDLPVSDLLG